MNANDITPVQEIAGMKFKRDDLYAPFGAGEVNGGKLRQCMMLVEAAIQRQQDIKGIITYCSIHSPQGPITAAVARSFNLPCIIAYGGAGDMSIATGAMPRLAMSYGADVRVIARSGRHKVLKDRADALARRQGLFTVQYGINLDDYGEVLIGAVAEQAQNIPDGLDDIYITCGSGITASGVIIGLEKYGKRVGNIHLISTAYDRRDKVQSTLRKFGIRRQFIYHDLFHSPGFAYEKKQKMRIGGVSLHPQYEAKAMKYIMDNGLNTRNALFWIVGAEPKAR